MSIQSLVVGSLLALYCAGALAQEAAITPTEQETAPPPATVTGSGTANYIPMWTGASTLGNSKLYQTGGRVGVATTAPLVQLDVNGRINASKSYRLQGYDILTSPGGLGSDNIVVGYSAGLSGGSFNTAIGSSTLEFGSSGDGNTAVGGAALRNNSAIYNTAVGAYALSSNQGGYENEAFGFQSLYSNSSGSNNTASGTNSLYNNTTGNENVAVGFQSLLSNSTGCCNTAIGDSALQNNQTGIWNIAIGISAGGSVSAGNSYNIHIGNSGASTDNGTIRIGDSSNQTSFFAAGISGTTTGLNNAVPVVIDSNGQLGTINSSRRFKEDIRDMGESSDGLMHLRPVIFRYQKPFADGTKPVQYGLIAEEVAAVYPDLVTHSADGQVESVKYQVLDSMLLNEVQKQQGTIQQQQAEIDGLKKKLEKVEAALASTSGAK